MVDDAISYQGEQMQAAKCEQCSGKIYPVSLLPAHIERHKLRDKYVEEKWLTPLRAHLKASRL